MQLNLLSHAANAVSVLASCSSPAPVRAANFEVHAVESWMPKQRVLRGNAIKREFRAAARSHSTLTGDPLRSVGSAFAELRNLPDGWDGAGSVRPNEPAIMNASRVLRTALSETVVPPPVIVPVADGGIQAEWYNEKYHTEVYFEPTGEMAFWSEDRISGVEIEREGPAALQALLDWVAAVDPKLVLS